jgi:hypothetical protein
LKILLKISKISKKIISDNFELNFERLLTQKIFKKKLKNKHSQSLFKLLTFFSI